MLPVEFIRANNLPVIGNQEFRVVGQAEPHRADIAVAGVRWLGDDFETRVVVSEHGFALIGAELMIDCVLIVDYAVAVVSIERRI